MAGRGGIYKITEFKGGVLLFKKAFIIVLFLLIAITIINYQINKTDHVKVGNKAVDFSLEDSQGNLTSLSDFEGNIIILNFWASWCPPCVKEMPDLMEVGKKYEDNGVSVVAINRTTIEIQPEDAEEFLEDENIELFVLYDIEDEVSNLYNIPGVPVTLIIDQDFKVIKRINGEVNEEILIAEIEELL